MDEAHRRAADENGALLAPVGEHWWDYMVRHKDLEMYASDGAHASPEGAHFAAAIITERIWTDWIGRHYPIIIKDLGQGKWRGTSKHKDL